ncbi:MAG: hypothetical protein HZB32_03670 [Nitrospirae bacterium]|nr:hypothetical protein [Nitrospirota bacterium]
MKCIIQIVSFVIILTLIASCGSIRTGGDGTPVNTGDLVKNRLYKYSLARFASSPAMETYLTRRRLRNSLWSHLPAGAF